MAALLGVGVFGMGPGYLPEDDSRGEYSALPGSMREAGELSTGAAAAAPAGTF